MSFLPKFLLRIAKAVPPPEEGAWIMSIVIQRPYAHLEKELRSAFKGQKDVKVIVDQRYGERRTSKQAVEIDHRRADKRQPKEELIEAVISI